MEKKGTKIAYFVALAVVVVALVIAKVTNDGSGFVATGWALFPPVVAIALALISKEVYSSLFLGCVAAALLLANFQPWQMVVNFIGAGGERTSRWRCTCRRSFCWYRWTRC